ncbi:hypothetical protein TNCT_527141 [Trichonephila clavata]|uniref:Uncharacterized protein n=1 Tax=Trichonephila clavata TaxID=2740835 RepID=A0A8X6EYH6_TRICU|nr:hypothetical protein TNCT_527141 [Trichonephila clavata]
MHSSQAPKFPLSIQRRAVQINLCLFHCYWSKEGHRLLISDECLPPYGPSFPYFPKCLFPTDEWEAFWGTSPANPYRRSSH